MSSNLVPQPHQLQFQGQGFQALFIGQTCWFNGKAVCDILDLRNVSDALSRLEPEERSFLGALLAATTLGWTETSPELANSLPPEFAGIRRDALYVNESGLYSLVFTSRKPQAKQFRQWVTNEVLPTIREYGCYPRPSNPNQLSLIQASEKLLGLERRVKGMGKQLKRLKRERRKVQALNVNDGWVSLSGWCRRKGLDLSTTDASMVGKELAAFCRAKGVDPRRIKDEHYGYINVYPEDLIRQYMSLSHQEIRRAIGEGLREQYRRSRF